MRSGVGLKRAGAGRQTVVLDVHAGTVTIGLPGLRATNCWAGDPAQPSRKASARILATAATARAGPKPTCLHRIYSNETSEEGTFGGSVLAGNPVTDPMVAEVGRSAPSAIAPPGAAQADRAVEPMGIGPTRKESEPCHCNLNFLGRLFI